MYCTAGELVAYPSEPLRYAARLHKVRPSSTSSTSVAHSMSHQPDAAAQQRARPPAAETGALKAALMNSTTLQPAREALSTPKTTLVEAVLQHATTNIRRVTGSGDSSRASRQLLQSYAGGFAQCASIYSGYEYQPGNAGVGGFRLPCTAGQCTADADCIGFHQQQEVAGQQQNNSSLPTLHACFFSVPGSSAQSITSPDGPSLGGQQEACNGFYMKAPATAPTYGAGR